MPTTTWAPISAPCLARSASPSSSTPLTLTPRGPEYRAPASGRAESPREPPNRRYTIRHCKGQGGGVGAGVGMGQRGGLWAGWWGVQHGPAWASTPHPAPLASCTPRSRVGTTTTRAGPSRSSGYPPEDGGYTSRPSRGSRKASVLPDPVGAASTASRPAPTAAAAWRWMSAGVDGEGGRGWGFGVGSGAGGFEAAVRARRWDRRGNGHSPALQPPHTPIPPRQTPTQPHSTTATTHLWAHQTPGRPPGPPASGAGRASASLPAARHWQQPGRPGRRRRRTSLPPRWQPPGRCAAGWCPRWWAAPAMSSTLRP